jgi:hypothetical protein
MTARPHEVDQGRVAWLLAGGGALLVGTLLGWSGGLLEAIATPPALVRAALVAISTLGGFALLRESVRRIAQGRRVPTTEMSGRDMAHLIRAVRLVFLSVAAFAAAAGWLLGHPLPFVVALVIAGIDILETSLLLLVVSLRRDG